MIMHRGSKTLLTPRPTEPRRGLRHEEECREVRRVRRRADQYQEQQRDAQQPGWASAPLEIVSAEQPDPRVLHRFGAELQRYCATGDGAQNHHTKPDQKNCRG